MSFFSGESNLFEYEREKGNNLERKMLQIISSIDISLSQKWNLPGISRRRNVHNFVTVALRGSFHWRP